MLALSAFFVGAEYALVSTRRNRVESLAQKGSRSAVALLKVLDAMPRYVAGMQIGITLCGLALGSVVEPIIGHRIEQLLGTTVPLWASAGISLLLVTLVVVTISEIVPKYIALKMNERLALVLTQPLIIILFVLTPLSAVAQWLATGLLRIFGFKTDKLLSESISREELSLLMRASSEEGLLEETHANMVTRALRFDKLDSADIMVHRVDIKWIDVQTPPEQILDIIRSIPHSRVPVCSGDVDDVIGILYVNDFLRQYGKGPLDLHTMVRPAEIVPENLTLNRVIQRMREARTQILIVADEYGGTSGMITLEDVIEEVFGELEDALEGDRPAIERVSDVRLSARADVRYDELIAFLDKGHDDAFTGTLAQLLVSGLDRMPKLGDSVDFELGKLTVENMARRRITRVRIRLSDPPTSQPES